MLLIRLLRFLRGTVTFLIMGAFPEKLLNRCSRERISLWDAAPVQSGCRASAFAASYRRISRLARETGNRTRLQKKRGLPFLRFRYRKRWGLPVGAAAACFLLWYLSTHLWMISVAGCETLSERAVLSLLSECGVRIGASMKGIDPWEVEKRLLLMEKQLSWVTVNLNGATAQVVLSERTCPPETVDPSDRYANVVAAQDGQIRVLELYAGQALVRVGDVVSAGDVIVSGITSDQYGNARLKYARAKVIASVYEELSVTVPFSETVQTESETPVCARELYLFGRRLLPAGEDPALRAALRVETKATGFLYPFLLVRENDCFLPEPRVISRTPFEAKEEAVRRLRKLQAQGAPLRVIREELAAQETANAVTLRSVAYAEKDIARCVEFSVS